MKEAWGYWEEKKLIYREILEILLPVWNLVERDTGTTWRKEKIVIHPNTYIAPSNIGCEHITPSLQREVQQSLLYGWGTEAQPPRSSKVFGWLKPIDGMKLGFEDVG